MSEPLVEQNVIVGNVYDKHNAKNPIVRVIMKGFYDAMLSLIDSVPHASIHEVGCGEGYLLKRIVERFPEAAVAGSDISSLIIQVAKGHLPGSVSLVQKSIYELTPEEDGAQLVVASEVLEHLPEPEKALEVLSTVASPYCLLSVPREPLWRLMNMARGRYWGDLGNTPGHVNHWSTSAFCKLVSGYFDILAVRTPVPFTVVLCRSRKEVRQ